MIPAAGLSKMPVRCRRYNMQIQDAIQKIETGESLSHSEGRAVMQQIFSGQVPEEDIKSLLVGLRDKGETVEEVAGFAGVMRERAAETLAEAGVDTRQFAGDLLDTCGTGGDAKGTFNVSTAVALVAAGAGARVAKHGNRSISSRCGSADVLEALGVAVEMPLARIPECLETTGMVFLYAPRLHLSMKHVMGARRSLKTKTVFNLLGPLTNPLNASHQLAGVYDVDRTELVARALAIVGAKRAFVVAGEDGIDEISISHPTRLSEVLGEKVSTRRILPEEFGLSIPATSKHAIDGGDAGTNARIIMRVLEGEPGPYGNIVLANASAALVVAGIAADFHVGVMMAKESVASGRAKKTLDGLREFTQRAQ